MFGVYQKVAHQVQQRRAAVIDEPPPSSVVVLDLWPFLYNMWVFFFFFLHHPPLHHFSFTPGIG